MSGRDLCIVGGGIIGLAVAWRAAERGLDVTVVDDTPGRQTSRVAAGMLAPVTEVAYGEEELLALNTASARRWPSFAAELEAASDHAVGHRPDGTLVVGADADDVAALEHLRDFQLELGLDVRRLTRRELRGLEPRLAPGVRGGLLAGEDHQVDPRATVSALAVAAKRAGVAFEPARAARVETADGRVTGVVTTDAAPLTAERVLLAAGPWSARIGGLPEGAVPPVRPVKGQLLILRDPQGRSPLVRTVRGLVAGRPVYLVPRDDGRVVVGATQEERGEDRTVTAGGVRRLLDDATALVPGVDELELLETQAGLRPATPDNRPLLGPTIVDGLAVASGHHRHGVLLTPLTADALAAWAADEPAPYDLAAVDPRRFTAADATG